MAEILLPMRTHKQLLFPELEPLDPSASPPHMAISDTTRFPFQRGPMYSTYAELREWKLLMKKAGLSHSTPIPVQVRRPAAAAVQPVVARSGADLSMALRKDNRKPTPTVQRFEPTKSLQPAVPKHELKRIGGISANKGEEKRGCPPRGGSARADEFLLMRNFSSYQEKVTSRSEEEGNERKAESKGILRKTITDFRRRSMSNATC